MLKDFTLSLELEPTENRVVQTAAIFWSHDVNTAKIYIELLRKGTPIILNKDVTVRVMMLFDDENKSEHIYTAKIEDELKGLVSITLEESMRMYVGQVTCGVYVDYQNEEKTDNGYFTFGMRRSLIDKDMPELQKLYVSDFEKALEKFKEIEKKIEQNDVVTHPELKEYTYEKSYISESINQLNREKLDKEIYNKEIATKADEKEIIMLLDKKADRGSVNERFNSIDRTTRKKDVDITMRDLSQDVKEAMTGGSVAVVGENAVGTINVKDNAITSDKRTIQGETVFFIPNINGELPHFRTEDLTLTFPKLSLIVYRKNAYTFEEEKVVNLKETDGTIKRVYFDTITNEITVHSTPGRVDENKVLLTTVQTRASGVDLRANFPGGYFVDGNFMGTIEKNFYKRMPVKSEHIDDELKSSKLSAYTGNVYFILSSFEQYGLVPNLNTKTKMLEFPPDTLLVTQKKTYKIPTGTKIDLNVIRSSAKNVWFNTKTDKFTVTAYDYQQKDEDNVLVCSIRLTDNFNETSLSINSPYTVDGKLFGTLTKDFVSKSDLDGLKVDNPKNANVKAINHRGYNTIAPENTLSAYKLSKKNNFNIVETDVRFTKDNVPVLLHDETINRTARNKDGSVIAEQIKIEDITYQEALNYDFGIWKSKEFSGEKIPTLKEFLYLCKMIDMDAYIEVSEHQNLSEERLEKLVKTIKTSGAIDLVTIMSFSSEHVRRISEKMSGCRFALVTNEINQTTIEKAKTIEKNTDKKVMINSHWSAVNQETSELVLTNDFELEVWTIFDNDDNKFINLVSNGVSGMTTDNVNIQEKLNSLI